MPSTVTGPWTQAEVEPPKAGVTRSPAVKLAPVNTTSLPTTPLIGLKVSVAGASSVTNRAGPLAAGAERTEGPTAKRTEAIIKREIRTAGTPLRGEGPHPRLEDGNRRPRADRGSGGTPPSGGAISLLPARPEPWVSGRAAFVVAPGNPFPRRSDAHQA